MEFKAFNWNRKVASKPLKDQPCCEVPGDIKLKS